MAGKLIKPPRCQTIDPMRYVCLIYVAHEAKSVAPIISLCEPWCEAKAVATMISLCGSWCQAVCSYNDISMWTMMWG